jgi:hypothetical protein
VLITNAERGWIELNLGHGKITKKTTRKPSFLLGISWNFPRVVLKSRKKWSFLSEHGD